MSQPLSIWLLLTPPVLLLDYAGPAEALRMAAQAGAAFELHHCAAQSTLTTSVGTRIDGLEPLPGQLPAHSLVMVVGSDQLPVAGSCEAVDRASQWLATVPNADTRVASICAGALLLARAGLLAGRHCTTHYSLTGQLKKAEPRAHVKDNCLFVDDGRILTSAGITAGIDLCLYVIEQYAGARLAADIARRLVVFQRRAGADTQLSAWLDHRNHLHPAIHQVQDAIAHDPARSWSVAELAAQVHISPRHLSRLFADHTGTSVLGYQQSLRIARARQLLEHAHWTVERVAEATGFSSSRDFRRVWRRFHQASPGQVGGSPMANSRDATIHKRRPTN